MEVSVGKMVSTYEAGGLESSVLEDKYKIRLTSKKLHSGRCQVKFYAQVTDHRQLYGYVLVNSTETLNQVVEKIRARLDKMKTNDSFHHINLYSIGKRDSDDLNFIIFDA